MSFNNSPRNQLCFCGSGKKYKKCHLKKEREKPLSYAEYDERLRRALDVKICLAPKPWLRECCEQIVKAHTVPKSSSLSKIDRNGKVYIVKRNLVHFAHLETFGSSEKEPIDFALQGIKMASTFSGFCAEHDRSIFLPLENASHFSGSLEECFLLGYRALARELYDKMGALNCMPLFEDRDKDQPLEQQKLIVELNRQFHANIKQTLRNLSHHKSKYDQFLQIRDFHEVRGYVIKVQGPPPVMCCGVTEPHQDVTGVELQNLQNPSQTPDLLSVTSFYGGQHGIIAFSWLEQSGPACQAFIQSLDAIPNEKLTGVLLRYLFRSFHNLHISPDWWNSLDSASKSILQQYIKCIPEMLGHKPLQASDGLNNTPWTVVDRYEVR